jgi:hypothetical protein
MSSIFTHAVASASAATSDDTIWITLASEHAQHSCPNHVTEIQMYCAWFSLCFSFISYFNLNIFYSTNMVLTAY